MLSVKGIDDLRRRVALDILVRRVLTVELSIRAPEIDLGIDRLVKIGECAVVRTVRYCLTNAALDRKSVV